MRDAIADKLHCHVFDGTTIQFGYQLILQTDAVNTDPLTLIATDVLSQIMQERRHVGTRRRTLIVFDRCDIAAIEGRSKIYQARDQFAYGLNVPQ